MIAYLDTSVLLRVVLRETGVVLATHDVALGTAARSCGLRVVGIG